MKQEIKWRICYIYHGEDLMLDSLSLRINLNLDSWYFLYIYILKMLNMQFYGLMNAALMQVFSLFIHGVKSEQNFSNLFVIYIIKILSYSSSLWKACIIETKK